MHKSCIVCNSLENKVVFQEYGIDILKCLDCGHVFSSYDAIQDYDGFFGVQSIKSHRHFWWDEAHRQIHDHFCRKFVAAKSGRLLDVGCGLGYFVKRMSNFPSWQTCGCELSRPAVDFARNTLGLTNIFCGKVEDACLPKGTFDIITLWDVIEHIRNPDSLLSCVASLLNDEGLLFLHTPNVLVQLPKARLLKVMGTNIDYLEAKEHPNNYSSKTITRILNRNGFSNVRFTHLKPVQSVSGNRSQVLRFVKNSWFYSSVGLFYMTLGRINVDNLFVLAKK